MIVYIISRFSSIIAQHTSKKMNVVLALTKTRKKGEKEIEIDCEGAGVEFQRSSLFGLGIFESPAASLH